MRPYFEASSEQLRSFRRRIREAEDRAVEDLRELKRRQRQEREERGERAEGADATHSCCGATSARRRDASACVQRGAQLRAAPERRTQRAEHG